MVVLFHVRFGQTNEDIRAVQKALISRGHEIPGGPTGFFGEQPKAAYRTGQLAQGFTGADADGVPGCTSPTAPGHQARLQRRLRTAGTPVTSRVPSPVPVTFEFFARGPCTWKPDGVGRHTGQDLAARKGVPVVAVRNGTIT